MEAVTHGVEVVTDEPLVTTNEAKVVTNRLEVTTNEVEVVTNGTKLATNKPKAVTNKAMVVTGEAKAPTIGSFLPENEQFCLCEEVSSGNSAGWQDFLQVKLRKVFGVPKGPPTPRLAGKTYLIGQLKNTESLR